MESRTARLSIVVAPEKLSPFRKAFFEKTLQSLLTMTDPVGLEVIAVDDSAGDELLEYLKSVFSDAVRSGKLTLVASEPSGDPAHLFNRGAESATGTYLAFMMAGDEWSSTHLQQVHSNLKGKQLLFCGAWTSRQGSPSDWTSLITQLQSVKRSSVVIRETLFHELGGFPEGYSGLILPKKIPGQIEFEFVLKAIQRLMETEQKSGFAVIPESGVRGNELQNLPPALAQLDKKAGELRGLVSLLRMGRKLPVSFWPKIGKRLLDVKQIFSK